MDDNLSRLEDEDRLKFGKKAEIDDAFLDEQLLVAPEELIPLFADC